MKITLKFKILISFALSMALFMGCLCGCEKAGGSNKTSEDKNGYVTETMVTSETNETTTEITENSTAVPTAAPAPEDTPVPVVTGTATPRVTAKPTATTKVTAKPTATPKVTAKPTATPKVTAKPTATPTPKPTATPTPKPTATPTPSYSVSVGDYITFGSYEQDNNTSNGKEEIEWLVLDVEDGKALVISKYALDCQPYNTSYTYVTWETCTLRNWLNGTFYNSAFSSGEKSKIVTSYVEAEDNSLWGTDAGNSTNDKIFLLSISEAEEYFSSASARQCKSTAYAEAQGTYTNSSTGNCWWWLRSPCDNQNYASRVIDVGDLTDFGSGVSYDGCGVRPALWINLE